MQNNKIYKHSISYYHLFTNVHFICLFEYQKELSHRSDISIYIYKAAFSNIAKILRVKSEFEYSFYYFKYQNFMK